MFGHLLDLLSILLVLFPELFVLADLGVDVLAGGIVDEGSHAGVSEGLQGLLEVHGGGVQARNLY